MATLTITVDPETLERAEKKAAEQGISVDQVVENYLIAYANHVGQPPEPSADNGAVNTARKPFEPRVLSAEERKELAQSLKDLWALMDEHPSGSGPEGRTWTREEIYEDAIMRRDR
jgi:antitoxin component of RelBE/YafQ-DinJ toxin-antitoxin module